MDYAWFGVFAIAMVAAYMAGFNRGQREADLDWQRVLAEAERLRFQLRLKEMLPWTPTHPQEGDEHGRG